MSRGLGDVYKRQLLNMLFRRLNNEIMFYTRTVHSCSDCALDANSVFRALDALFIRFFDVFFFVCALPR